MKLIESNGIQKAKFFNSTNVLNVAVKHDVQNYNTSHLSAEEFAHFLV